MSPALAQKQEDAQVGSMPLAGTRPAVANGGAGVGAGPPSSLQAIQTPCRPRVAAPGAREPQQGRAIGPTRLPPAAPQAEAAAEASSSQQAGDGSTSSSAGAQASQESSQQQASSSGADDIKSKVFGTFSGFSSRFGGSSRQQQGAGGEQQPAGGRVKSLLDTVAREVKLAILPQTERISATRAPEEHEIAAPAEHNPDGPAALVVQQQEQTTWEKAYEQFRDKFGHHPLFQKVSKVRVQDSTVRGAAHPPARRPRAAAAHAALGPAPARRQPRPLGPGSAPAGPPPPAADPPAPPPPPPSPLQVYKKGQELAEDLRDKYETSDHPFVHKVEDVKERLFSESGTAQVGGAAAGPCSAQAGGCGGWQCSAGAGCLAAAPRLAGHSSPVSGPLPAGRRPTRPPTHPPTAPQAMREMRARDPAFDMIRFMAAVKVDAPVVVKAFLTHDLGTLRRHCGPELMERFTGGRAGRAAG